MESYSWKTGKFLNISLKYCHNPQKDLGAGPNFGKVSWIVVHVASIQLQNRWREYSTQMQLTFKEHMTYKFQLHWAEKTIWEPTQRNNLS